MKIRNKKTERKEPTKEKTKYIGEEIKNFKEFKDRELKNNPELKKEYDKLETDFIEKQLMLDLRKSENITQKETTKEKIKKQKDEKPENGGIHRNLRLPKSQYDENGIPILPEGVDIDPINVEECLKKLLPHIPTDKKGKAI